MKKNIITLLVCTMILGNTYSQVNKETSLIIDTLSNQIETVSGKIDELSVKIDKVQETADVNKETLIKLKKLALSSSSDPAVSNPVTYLRVFTVENKTTAAMNFSLNLDTNFTTNVEIAAPIAKSGQTELIGMDGLASDGKITIGANYVFWKPISSKTIVSVLKKYKVKKYTTASKVKRDSIKQSLREAGELNGPWFMGLTGTVNKQSFEFATDTSLSIFHTKQEYAFGSSFYFGKYLGAGARSLVRFSAQMKNYYEGNRSRNYLVPFNSKSYIEKEIVIGSPVFKEEYEMKVEFAHLFNKIGVNPNARYLVNDEKLVFNVPVFIAFEKDVKKDKFLGLNGGFYVNCIVDDSDPWSFGIFVGTSFDDLLSPKGEE